MGLWYPTSLTSLVYNRPAIDMAVEHVNAIYNNSLQMNVNYIYRQYQFDCPDLEPNAVDMISNWYYKQRVDGIGTVPVIVNTGK